MRGSLTSIASLLALAVGAAGAQPSTSRIGEPETRSWHAEVGGGTALLPIRDMLGLAPGEGANLLAGLASLRWAPESGGGFRATGWWLQRSRSVRVYDQSGTARRERSDERVAALGLAADVMWRLGRRATLIGSIGGALASARGDGLASYYGTAPEGGPVSESGRMWTAGVALRVGRLVIEQHGLGLLGAERAIPESREFFPLTASWRF